MHSHNQAITAVRADLYEIRHTAKVIAGLGNAARGPVAIVVPMKGFSAFDSPRGPLYDPEGPKALAEVLETELDDPTLLTILPLHINDPEFAQAVIEEFERLVAESA